VFFFFLLLPGKEGFLSGSFFFGAADLLMLLFTLFLVCLQGGPGAFMMARIHQGLARLTLVAFKIHFFGRGEQIAGYGEAELEAVKLFKGKKMEFGFVGLGAKYVAGNAITLFIKTFK
jgi:hypothetical protein